MTSQKQIEANLANAQLSTGPRTNRGKARSKMNAVKHALTAAQGVLIEGEDPEEFEAKGHWLPSTWRSAISALPLKADMLSPKIDVA